MEILKLKKHIMNTARNTPAKSIVTGLRFFAGASGLILVYALPATGTVKKQISKPNIILILSDDMGYECLGAYGSTYSTPNLDRLAEEGILFTHAYSQPLSTPSRVELMTGRYNHRNYAEFGFLNHDQQTFGNLAKEAGYRTCIAGKWQLGSNSGLPSHFGFDRYCLWQLNYGRSKSGERYADPLIEADGKLEIIFNTFGRNPQERQVLSLVVTDTGGVGHEFNFDVTEEFEDNPEQIIRIKTDKVVIDEPKIPDGGGGGLAPDVDEWDDIIIDIPI